MGAHQYHRHPIWCQPIQKKRSIRHNFFFVKQKNACALEKGTTPISAIWRKKSSMSELLTLMTSMAFVQYYAYIYTAILAVMFWKFCHINLSTGGSNCRPNTMNFFYFVQDKRHCRNDCCSEYTLVSIMAAVSINVLQHNKMGTQILSFHIDLRSYSNHALHFMDLIRL